MRRVQIQPTSGELFVVLRTCLLYAPLTPCKVTPILHSPLHRWFCKQLFYLLCVYTHTNVTPPPTNICSKLVNKSVPNTVDLRALTRISASASDAQRKEALKENMTLALESARAIGCRVNEDSIDNILGRNPQTVRDFLVDLIRVRQFDELD